MVDSGTRFLLVSHSNREGRPLLSKGTGLENSLIQGVRLDIELDDPDRAA